MLRKPSPVFNRLLDRISGIPVVDCHDHLRGPDRDLEDAYTEPILALTVPLYLISDLWSAGASDEEIELLQSEDATTDEKWPIFSRLWAATEHTAFARVTKLMLREAYGIETLTRQSLDRIVEQRTSYNRSHYMKVIRDAGIKAVIADVIFALSPPPWGRPIRYFRSPVLREFLEGRFPMPDMWHPAFPLPYFHEIRHREFIDFVGVMSNSNITSLDEFEEAMFEVVKRSVDLGVIAFKDQSAYCRVISYDLPARGDAERIFNKLLIDPRNQLAWPDAKPLDDYLFHQYMRFARELHLPVQVHTGHMAGIRNRVDKANAANFASVLELHTAVQFDLFHGNWPYMGDVLFLGKNYPNVTLDFCWVQMMDPLYAQELLKRAVMTVPHAKIHGFGGDYFLEPEPVAAHLALAREVFAGALADLVECGWLGEEKAVHLAADWLFNNPNRFYNLGLEPYDGC
jgi:predicted TIM-barrel fold metal-dependent hydrolase